MKDKISITPFINKLIPWAISIDRPEFGAKVIKNVVVGAVWNI